MKKGFRDMMAHGVLTVLFALGVTMPVLGMLGLLGQGWMAVGIVLLLSVLMALCSVNKWTGVGLAAVLVGGGALWLAGMGGAMTVSEVLTGLLLNASGQTAALPVIADKAVMVISVLVTVLSFGMMSRSVGALPSALIAVLAMVLLWLCGAGKMLLLAIPAVAAAMTLAAVSRNDELRTGRVLPVMMAVAAAAFLIVPASGVTIPPMKEAADELRQRILDYFFFTEPRNVFTLASEGYYPQGNGQLGGAATPSNRPVMIVYTPKKAYLRGSIRNEYTGGVWNDTTGGRRYLWISPRWRQIRDRVLDAELPPAALNASSLLETRTLSVRMVGESQSSLFVPQRVRSLSTGGDLVPYFNQASEVFITRDLEEGDTYTVTAPLVTSGMAGLDTILAACEQSADMDLYNQVRYDYTALPGHLQSQVFELAQRAIEGASTPYEKAFAIQNWLQRTYKYTLDVTPQQENVDFVSSFLLVTKEGYCTYFASAMTVLCRMVGLPARYIEGYVATPDAEGVAQVTGLDAHAWTEVYFAGFGWLTFDATPTRGGSGQTPPEDSSGAPEPSPEPSSQPDEQPTPTPEPSEEPEDQPTPEPEDDPETLPTPEPSDEPPVNDSTDQEPPSPVWWIVLLLLAVIAALAARVWWTLPQNCAARAKDDYIRWQIWLYALCELLNVSKYPRWKNETMSVYLTRVSPAFASLHFREIGECSTEVFYGGRMPEASDVTTADRACSAVLRRLPVIKRMTYLLRRAFRSAKKIDFTKV